MELAGPAGLWDRICGHDPVFQYGTLCRAGGACARQQRGDAAGADAQASPAMSQAMGQEPDNYKTRPITDLVPQPGVLVLSGAAPLAELGRYQHSLLDMDSAAVSVGYGQRTGLDDRGLLYLIDRAGKVAYKGGRGPFGFRPGELEQAIILNLLENKTAADATK